MSQLKDVFGFFANMLPIRAAIEDDMSFAECLETFRCGLVADLKHLFAPGGLNMRIVHQLNTSDITTTPILSLPNGEEKYEFLLTVHYETDEVVLCFDNCLYTEETAYRFLDPYLSLVDIVGKNPHLKIGDISTVNDDEVTRLIKELSSFWTR